MAMKMTSFGAALPAGLMACPLAAVAQASMTAPTPAPRNVFDFSILNFLPILFGCVAEFATDVVFWLFIESMAFPVR
jgi:hypothetical protein